MDAAGTICARLLREGAIPLTQLPELDHLDVRIEVEARLRAVGLALATSAYSDHVGIRLSADVVSEPGFDAASNMGLKADACALLVALWGRLALQKRTALDRNEAPGQASLFPEEAAKAVAEFSPQVRFETLVREFGHIIGSRSHMLRLVSQLRRLGFVKVLPGHVIEAGPLLELAIDGERMIAYIRRGVLKDIIEQERSAPPLEEADTLETRILRTMRELGDAGIGEIERVTGEHRGRLKRILRELEDSGQIRRTGERGHTRYHVLEG